MTRDVVALLALAEAQALQVADGHLTILRFTTGWKVALGTPDLLGGDGYGELRHMLPYPSLEEALLALLGKPRMANEAAVLARECAGFPCRVHESNVAITEGR